jgi:hypothetical protein
MVSTSCSPPPIIATRPRPRSSLSDSSAPRANIRNATPISARIWMEWTSARGPGVNGPMITPASK